MPSFEFPMGKTLKERVEEAITKARDDAQDVLARGKDLHDPAVTRLVLEARTAGIEAALIEIATDIHDLTARPHD